MSAYTVVMDGDRTLVGIDAADLADAVGQAVALSDGAPWLIENGAGEIVAAKGYPIDFVRR